MTTKLTLFTATLVQDSALAVSGVDRESSGDQPFALVDGVPILAGRGLKGAAVAMAKRFFDPLPRSVSEDAGRRTALRRSAWEFADANPVGDHVPLRTRAGVGIRHKTGARAGGVLYDREVVPAGTRWRLTLRVDWSQADEEAAEAEGILGYVLAEHWSKGRCWLGGGAARGLGWCHLEDLRAFRLDPASYDRWVESGRKKLPDALRDVPAARPTRGWCFRTLDVDLSFGEHRPDPEGPAWGVDMLAIGPHDSERATQPTGCGAWARPAWALAGDPTPDAIPTDRAILMDGDRPLLPGSSVRGPLRHAFTRARNAAGEVVQDPHLVQGAVDPEDAGGKLFGTVAKSSRVLVRDGVTGSGWTAARLHMHAEDEFSAGSYGSAKRDAVRLLRGQFPVRIVVEGPDPDTVAPLVAEIDRLTALGALGHLPIGGHKTRGAGWGRWTPHPWVVDDVQKVRDGESRAEDTPRETGAALGGGRAEGSAWSTWRGRPPERTRVRVTHDTLDASALRLGAVAELAGTALGQARPLVAWWCEPTIDLTLARAPATFGRSWPDGDQILVDEVAFYADRAVWRAARTATGARWVLIEEVDADAPEARVVEVVHTPARLHGSARFSAADTGRGRVVLREWRERDEILGFTLVRESA